ncbi:MAG: acyltransferase [Rhizorhabdus sp.]|nr:acyltransferase [Rhizorhabdus sp.]
MRAGRAWFFGGPSVDEKLKLYRGAGPGFDFWRFLLSTCVIFLHSFHVAYGTFAGGDRIAAFNPFFAAILPVFFGLSGFLVAGSALRTADLKTFLGFRALRLVPALAVEVTLSALILGPLLTTVPLSAYFTTHEFFTYWGNIIGRVRYNLPGLFANNPIPHTVNENLWTLHAELTCYAIMAVAILVGLLHRRRLALALWGSVTIGMIAMNVTAGWFARDALYPTNLFVYSFCTGVIAFLWRDRIPLSPLVMIASLIAYLACYQIRELSVVAMLPLTYVMIWVGMQPRLQSTLFKKGDYSYGLYLYGFVIQQTLALLVPQLREWWFIFPSTMILTLTFAITSWHFIEKPALRLKKIISPRAAAPAGTAHPHQQAEPELRRLEEAESGKGAV